MNNTNNKKRFIVGLFLAIVTIFIWGITFVSTKYLLRYFSSLEILILRLIIAYVSLCIIYPKPLKLATRKHELYFIAAGLLGLTIYQLLENVAINFTSAGNVSVIVSICPLFTAIIAQLILKEKHITFWFVLGFILAIFGICLVTFNGTTRLHLSPKGDLLALSAAISWGFYSLFVSKINAFGYSSLATTRRIFFWALVSMIPLTILGTTSDFAQTFVNLNPTVNAERFSNFWVWFNLLFLGLGASAFCFASWNVACNSLGTVKATTGIYLIPVVTIVFAFFVLHEKMTVVGVVGSALTIIGLFLSIKKKPQQLRP